MSCPHHQETSRRSTMGSFSKPSSLLYLNDETPRTPERGFSEVPRTPERSSASSIVTTTPSAPKKPRRPPSESPFHHYTGFDRVRVPTFASTAMDLDPVFENETTGEGTNTNTTSGSSSSSSGDSNDEASYQSTTSSPPLNVNDNDHSDNNSEKKPTRSGRRHSYPASIERVLTYDAPDVFLDDDLTLLSYGHSSLAIALDDQLFFCQRETPQIELFTCTQDGHPISCVQWSPIIGQTDKAILAVGLETSVQLWSVERGGTLLEFHGHSGHVTAIGWKPDGTEMLVASSGAGIYRYNLLADDPNNCIHYAGGEASTCLRWSDHRNLIASAGNGLVNVWGTKKQREDVPVQPLLTLPHTGIRCLEFSPCGNLMASGGDGGIHFWNLDSGLLRGSISTDAPVTALIWSCFDEIMVAHGDKLSIWNVETTRTPRKIAQLETGSKILCLSWGFDGRVACLNENETCNVFSIQGNSTMAQMGEANLLKQSAVI